uniref:DUF4123 domain-containing protein n=1 Tax=Thaumasiovibrio occultus TaxID=1891184 RepID=UPI000B358D40|nr:DUF4123 domain-containing protein [Thaumasiovibrio occultus]
MPISYLQEHGQFWLVFDVVAAPEIAEHVANKPNTAPMQPLFLGTHFEHLLEFSPCMVKIDDLSSTLNLIRELPNAQKCCLIFCFPDAISEAEVFLHFQQLIQAHIHGQPSLFRFFSQSFWVNTAKELTHSDLSIILGDASHIFWFDHCGRLSSLNSDDSSTYHRNYPYSLDSPVLLQWFINDSYI